MPNPRLLGQFAVSHLDTVGRGGQPLVILVTPVHVVNVHSLNDLAAGRIVSHEDHLDHLGSLQPPRRILNSQLVAHFVTRDGGSGEAGG